MIFYSSALAKINTHSAVALGCFDGVHIGHSKIVSSTVAAAKEKSLTSVVWSFQTPPKNILSGTDTTGLLTPSNEKKRLMRGLGVDVMISVPFNKKIARLTPRDFFENILIKRLGAKHIFCGFNYRFGYMGSGDVTLLRSLCEEFGIALTVVDEVKIDGITVSSSAIRALLSEGMLDKAEKMLGRPFSVCGKVKDGQHLGRRLGFPTVNQEVPNGKTLLKNGVYLTRIKLGKAIKYGVTNIGMRPTVSGKEPICETHILDFDGDLYGKYLTVEFITFLRSEKKFDSLDELSLQVMNDIETAKKFLNKI